MKALPTHFVLSLPVNALAYPQLFVTKEDDKRRGKTTYKTTLNMLKDAKNVEINGDNSYSVHYFNGAYYHSAERIGVDENTSFVLQAMLDSGLPIYKDDTLLNATEDYLGEEEEEDEPVYTEEPAYTE